MSKLLGLILVCVSAVLYYIDAIIFMAIGALTKAIAVALGVTGEAVLGVQIIGWILTLTVLASIFVCATVALLVGIALIFNQRFLIRWLW